MGGGRKACFWSCLCVCVVYVRVCGLLKASQLHLCRHHALRICVSKKTKQIAYCLSIVLSRREEGEEGEEQKEDDLLKEKKRDRRASEAARVSAYLSVVVCVLV